jgi:beta-phosphoglucomutase
MIKACIFDLDGVIVDTAKYHFIAWRRLANELGFDFSEKENEKLKGVSRMDSLDLILQWGGKELSPEQKEEWAARKNEWYREFILNMQPDEILDGVIPFLDHLEDRGIKIALGSSSKNATTIIEQVGLKQRFDAIIDGNHLSRSKPDPQVFQLGAEALALNPDEIIVFEDAAKGVDAALAGGFWAVGVGEEEHLGHAHYVLPDFIGYTFEKIVGLTTNNHIQDRTTN